ncbi:uncharacterized protein LOC143562194 [Bidens hawaiensis]|uniref:uncharacterized protein LOC143562194 n=1 Tax=Bidens hawaiensis TaxID=980011 RepID=UPI0040498803
MPSLKMKTNSNTGCLTEKNSLSVCQKSNKISKNSSSQVKKDVLFSSEAIVKELRTDETNCCDLLDEESHINKNSCEYHGCNVSDFCISDMIASSSPVQEECILPDYECNESSLFLSDEHMLLPSLEDINDCGDNIKWYSEESNLYLSIHQESDDFPDWDPQLFIKNLPDVADMEMNLCPTVSPCERKTVTLVLDLDETLVHSSLEHCDDADFTFPIVVDFKEHTVYVKQRPHLKDFLKRVSEMFQVMIFTASQSIYAKPLLDILDPDGKIISHRAYRESCTFEDGSHTKDLTVLGVDLAKVAIIDNYPQVFRLQVNNGIPIKSWFDDSSDCELITLLPFLETLADAEDVRPLIARRFGNKE